MINWRKNWRKNLTNPEVIVRVNVAEQDKEINVRRRR